MTGVLLSSVPAASRSWDQAREKRVKGSHREDVYRGAVRALLLLVDANDSEVGTHLRRVQALSLQLGRHLMLSRLELETLEMAALLHDVGKVTVPDSILNRPGRLTDEEFNRVAAHADIGAEIISALKFPGQVIEVVRSHHEHWDGSGYPRGLRGLQIPLPARVLTVADCFDALVRERAYRSALPVQQALEVMREQRGRIFDPAVFDMFSKEMPAILRALEGVEIAHPVPPRVWNSTQFCQTWLGEPVVQPVAV